MVLISLAARRVLHHTHATLSTTTIRSALNPMAKKGSLRACNYLNDPIYLWSLRKTWPIRFLLIIKWIFVATLATSPSCRQLIAHRTPPACSWCRNLLGCIWNVTQDSGTSSNKPPNECNSREVDHRARAERLEIVASQTSLLPLCPDRSMHGWGGYRVNMWMQREKRDPIIRDWRCFRDLTRRRELCKTLIQPTPLPGPRFRPLADERQEGPSATLAASQGQCRKPKMAVEAPTRHFRPQCFSWGSTTLPFNGWGVEKPTFDSTLARLILSSFRDRPREVPKIGTDDSNKPMGRLLGKQGPLSALPLHSVLLPLSLG